LDVTSPSGAVSLRVVEYDRGERIARITIEREHKLNVLDAAAIRALNDTVTRTAADDTLRAVIVTGAGDRAFVGGADVNVMATLDRKGAEIFISELHEAIAAIRNIPVPVIARINGYCLGAGLELAAACDLRIASDHARFGMPEVRVGIPSVIEAALLPRLVGWGNAARLLLLGDTITADEALRIGLIERMVAAARLDGELEQWVASILAAGPRALRLQKALMRRWEQLPLEDAIRAGIETFRSSFDSDEPHRFMAKFINRNREM
jgi:enoyl-CoA hydratase/carnithine racemase